MGTIGALRVRELAAARELLRPERATTDHDRVLDVVAERVLLDLFSPGWRGRDAQRGASVVVSTRMPGRIASPAAC